MYSSYTTIEKTHHDHGLLLILPVEVAKRTIARTEVLIDTMLSNYMYLYL
jgi:hypothetical protein